MIRDAQKKEKILVPLLFFIGACLKQKKRTFSFTFKKNDVFFVHLMNYLSHMFKKIIACRKR